MIMMDILWCFTQCSLNLAALYRLKYYFLLFDLKFQSVLGSSPALRNNNLVFMARLVEIFWREKIKDQKIAENISKAIYYKP